jgi:hypothetical protein
MNEIGDIVISLNVPAYADKGEVPGQATYQITIKRYEMGRIE